MGNNPLTIIENSITSVKIFAEKDKCIRVWSIFSEHHKPKNFIPEAVSVVTLFEWEYLQCFVVVFKEVILFLKEEPFRVIGHLELNEREEIQKSQSFGTYLYI